MGIIKLSETKNLNKNVKTVLSQIFLVVVFFLDSSAMCIPNESESASAIAITKIPLMITDLEPVPEFKPIIKPRVVIVPDVKPNPSPLFIELLIISKLKVSF